MNAVRKYRRRPLVVTAMNLTEDNIRKVAKWCGAEPHPRYISINTDEGSTIALVGDWVVKEAGSYIRVSNDMFSAMYEEVFHE